MELGSGKYLSWRIYHLILVEIITVELILETNVDYRGELFVGEPILEDQFLL